jgi:hypothetical protein
MDVVVEIDRHAKSFFVRSSYIAITEQKGKIGIRITIQKNICNDTEEYLFL